ncbi:MAG: isoprenyl transferase [Paludibacteraceae bacterium]|nr:isoprenyl transferase [Paludibacteraceae bacterium]
MGLKEQIDANRIPQHVAIIMDGNGRWAKSKGLDRIFGHREGVDSVDKVMEAASDLGVKYITLYAFSTENWNRPDTEVNALMEILSEALKKYIEKISQNNVRLMVIGDKSRLSKVTLSNLSEAEKMTEGNTGLTMILAISYSSRWEIVEATKRIAAEVKTGALNVEAINEQIFSNHLATAGIPDPDLLVRTSGELRISNFLMWQLSYSELYFTPVSWPEFKKEQFFEAIIDYQKRERRFGKTSEQLS